MRVIAYAYEADIHCLPCAEHRFGVALDRPETEDTEGNPIGAVFSTDETPEWGLYCGDCGDELVAPSTRDESDDGEWLASAGMGTDEDYGYAGDA